MSHPGEAVKHRSRTRRQQKSSRRGLFFRWKRKPPARLKTGSSGRRSCNLPVISPPAQAEAGPAVTGFPHFGGKVDRCPVSLPGRPSRAPVPRLHLTGPVPCASVRSNQRHIPPRITATGTGTAEVRSNDSRARDARPFPPGRSTRAKGLSEALSLDGKAARG